MTMRRTLHSIFFCTAVLFTGCNAYRLETPAGFAQVDKGDYGAHYKGSENVGLRIARFDNVKGGTLAFWSEDLVRKLGSRGYTLKSQRPAKSDNGLPGTRFDFTYLPPGTETEHRTYSVVLFVSDKHLIVVQLAGRPDAAERYGKQLDEITADMRVRGCRAWTDICDSAQPALLSTPPQPDKKPAGPDEEKGAAEKTELASETTPTG